MVAELLEEQWELDGIVFGDGTPTLVLEDGLDYGTSEHRVQDAERPQGDGLLMGRDYLGPPEWSLTLGVGVAGECDVWALMSELQQAWRADSVRTTPGAMSVLRFRRRGVTYRVLGRPRKFGIQPGNHKDDEFQTVVATFQLAAPEYYIEGEDEGGSSRLVLRLVDPPSTTGVRLPARLPWRLGGASGARMGEVTVGGQVPAPFRLQIHGPTAGTTTSGFKVSGDGWEIETSASLAYDRSLIVDTAANTIVRDDGVSLASTLTRKSRLTARLQPGHQFIRLETNDSTGSSYAVLTWFETVPA